MSASRAAILGALLGIAAATNDIERAMSASRAAILAALLGAAAATNDIVAENLLAATEG